MDHLSITSTSDFTRRKLSQRLNISNPFKRKEEVRKLTDPQFDEKIKEVNILAEKMNNEFAGNYEKVKKEINTIHNDVLRKLKANKEISSQAKIRYNRVCETFTSSNKALRFSGLETNRNKFRVAVKDYLNFVQEIDLNNQGKTKTMEKLLSHVKDMSPEEIRLLAHQFKMKALEEAKDAIIIDFKKNPPQKKKVETGLSGGTTLQLHMFVGMVG